MICLVWTGQGYGEKVEKDLKKYWQKKVWIFTHNDFKGYTLRHPFTSSGLGTSLRALKHKVSKQYTHNLKKVPYIFFFFFLPRDFLWARQLIVILEEIVEAEIMAKWLY